LEGKRKVWKGIGRKILGKPGKGKEGKEEGSQGKKGFKRKERVWKGRNPEERKPKVSLTWPKN